MTIFIWGPKDKAPENVEVINTTSRSLNWSKGLSPFFLGPVQLYDGHISSNVENAWQFSKVYKEFVDEYDNPTNKYYEWAESGWLNPKAIRYPMGKGKKPLYSLWSGEKLGYIEARARIYVPLYSMAVLKTEAYAKLRELYNKGGDIHLWDFDGYNRHKMTLKDVLNNPHKSMGHAFVLAALLYKGL